MTQPKRYLSAKWHDTGIATFQRLNLWLCIILLIVSAEKVLAQDAIETAAPTVFPSFRYVDPSITATGNKPLADKFTLLADSDFAPWSFLGENGQVQGISVDLASAACAEAGLNCEISPTEFSGLLQKLRSGQAQAVISGFKLDAAVASEFALSKPYFRSLGRFAVRAGSPLAAPDIRTLAGRRIGYRSNTAHARFLENFYSRSALTPFDTSDAMLEALRTGQVDAVFGDAVQLSFWLKGNASRGCCGFLGKAFVHRDTFSRSLSFIISRDKPELRIKLDAALDQLEAKGITAEIFARYLPASIW
jgi:polar amino acid transport system substrate-binding protein